jgi:hypothetical protein
MTCFKLSGRLQAPARDTNAVRGPRAQEGDRMRINRLEILALKKLAVICGALAESLKDHSASQEQKALTSVLVDVVNRAEMENAGRASDDR